MTYSLGAATWHATEGRFVPPSGATVSFFAPARGGAVTITAVGSGCSATITFTIVEPSGVVQDRIVSDGLKHNLGRPDIGIHTKPYLMPDDVSFYNVQWRELEVWAVSSGVYANMPNTLEFRGHHPNSSPIGCKDVVVPGKGTETFARWDNLYSGDPGTAPPFAAGSVSHPIPWEFSVVAAAMGGSPSPMKQFAVVTQTCALAADLTTLTLTKGGAFAICQVSDPTSTLPT